jgi:hypothetical protein
LTVIYRGLTISRTAGPSTTIQPIWLIPSGQHNSFVYNFNDHESSVVTYDLSGDPSLGSVFIVKAGPNPIP